MLPFPGNNQKHKLFGVPPEHFAIGLYIYKENLPLGNIALQDVIENKCRKVWLMVFSDDFLHFLKINIFFGQIHQNYLVPLTHWRLVPV